MPTTIKYDDLTESIAASLQYISAAIMRRCSGLGMRTLIASLALLSLAETLHAQDRAASFSIHDPAVTFEPGLHEMGLFTSISNKTFRPSGTGPWPAVVIGHTCGGVGNAHIRLRAKELLMAGFVVLTTDSYGPRGISQCRGQTKVDTRHQVIDGYGAIRHLRQLQEIDASRIYYVGYSAGGIAAAQLASTRFAPDQPPLRFRAIVSNYASCVFQWGPTTLRSELLMPDADTPLLMLMADRDNELRASDCFPLLEEMKTAGKPVEWHIYKDTYHAWDQPGVRFSITNGFGQSTDYFHSATATKDSTARMIEFFGRHR